MSKFVVTNRCHIAPYVQDYVKVIAWIQDGSVTIKPGLDTGKILVYIVFNILNWNIPGSHFRILTDIWEL